MRTELQYSSLSRIEEFKPCLDIEDADEDEEDEEPL
jgi:hypothetical protein